METSILLADSQRMIRQGLRGILAVHPEFRVIAEAADGREAVAAARKKEPDVALVESHLPRLCGVETVRLIRRESPRTRCIVLSSQEGAGHVRQALLAGASGFVPKNSSAEDLVEAIRKVRRGRSYLAPAIADQVLSAITSRAAAPLSQPDLTSRQREVIQLIAEGLSTKEIAAELGISVKTAQTHRANLMKKVGVHKASGLVRYAVREGIVSA